MVSDSNTTRKKDMDKLRRRLDGDDRFFGSHQIKKIRTRERDIPTWTLNDKEVRKILLRVFPLLKTHPASQRMAGRWSRIIHLYYRVQMSNSQVAKEMGMTLNALKMVLKSIRRVAKGRRADNSGPWIRPIGRPRKKKV
jgi:hypothetical protein